MVSPKRAGRLFARRNGIVKGYVDTRMGQLHYVAAGTGSTLALVPHAGRSSQMYAELIPLLAQHFRVVVFDLPGTGLSPAPSPALFTVEDIADCLLDGFDALGETTFSLFGLHAGNKVAASLVARHPERVSRFILAGQSHSIVLSNRRRAEVFAATPSVASVVSTDQALAGSPVMWSREFQSLTALWWADDAVLDPGVDRRQRTIERVVDSLQSLRWRPFYYRALSLYDMESDLRRIRVPTLVMEIVTPKEDRDIGRQGEELLRAIPGSTLVTLEAPDALTVTLEEHAPEVARLLLEFFPPATHSER